MYTFDVSVPIANMFLHKIVKIQLFTEWLGKKSRN